MRDLKLSCCRHPTTAVFIDDSESFLKMVELGLNNVSCLFFSDPEEALHYLNKSHQPDLFPQHCVAQSHETLPDQVTVNIDIRNIHKEIYNPNRLNQISVLYVDYAMPSMNGLEFFQQINVPFARRILLTGEAGQDIAVNAFNDGHIDRYISKSSVNMLDVIRKAHQEEEKKFFLKLHDLVFNNTSGKMNQPITCLFDPAFVTFFEQLCEKNNIAEYYLMDNMGSFLLLDQNGNPSWLALKTASELEALYQHAQIEEAHHDVIQQLKTKESLVYFFSDQDLQTPPTLWHHFLFPAQQIKGEETYYYAYIDNPTAFHFDAKNMLA